MKRPLLYVVSLVWNVLVGLPLVVAPVQAVAALGMDAPGGALAEYNARLLGSAVIVFGLIYFEIGRDLAGSVRFLRLAILAKAVTVVLGLVMATLHAELWRLVGGAIVVDFVFGLLFLRDLRALRKAGASH